MQVSGIAADGNGSPRLLAQGNTGLCESQSSFALPTLKVCVIASLWHTSQSLALFMINAVTVERATDEVRARAVGWIKQLMDSKNEEEWPNEACKEEKHSRGVE